MTIRKLILFIIATLIILSCSKKENEATERTYKIKYSFIEFSTEINVALYKVPEPKKIQAQKEVELSEKVFSFFDSAMNPSKDTSIISNLSIKAKKERVAIPNELTFVINESAKIYRETDGAFDVTTYPIYKMWGFHADSVPEVPDFNELDELVSKIGFDKVELRNDSIKFLTEEIEIGLGAIAKGLAVDSCVAKFRGMGYNDILIEAGGDLACYSEKYKVIGVRHPRRSDILLDTLYIKDMAVATSGDYEKYIEKDGKRYCHIFDPKKGYSDSDLISVTIIANKAYLADAYATAVFVMGFEKGSRFIKDKNLSAILCTEENGKVVKNYFSMDKYKNIGN